MKLITITDSEKDKRKLANRGGGGTDGVNIKN